MKYEQKFTAAVFDKNNDLANEIINRKDFDLNGILKIKINHKTHFATPFLYAAYANNIDVAKALLNKGVDINQTDNFNWSAVHYRHETLDFLKFLINNGADVNIKDSEGQPVLFKTTLSNIDSDEKVKIMVNHGADINFKHHDNGMTILMLVAKHGYIETLEFLLSVDSQNIDDQNKDGKTALMLATNRIDPGFIKPFLDHHADLYIKDSTNKDAIDYVKQDSAMFLGSEESLKLLNSYSEQVVLNKTINDEYSSIELTF